jgi:hypothetical protein
MRPARLHTIALCASVLNACAGRLPQPPRIRHPDSAYIDVPYAPPAALSETVLPRPTRADVVWVDGDWVFRGNSYAWRRGGWVVAAPRTSYARSEVAYALDGRVRFAPPTWYDAQGTPLDRVRPVVPAGTPANEYTAESQTSR